MLRKLAHLPGEPEVDPRRLRVAAGMVVHEDDGARPERQAAGKELPGLEVDVGADTAFDPLDFAPVALPVLGPEPQPLARLPADLGRERRKQVPRKTGPRINPGGRGGPLAIKRIGPRKGERRTEALPLARRKRREPGLKNIRPELVDLEEGLDLRRAREAGGQHFQQRLRNQGVHAGPTDQSPGQRRLIAFGW